jgi:hypothetical protein
MAMIYVLTMWDQAERRHELILNGPFADEKTAGTWGHAWSIKGGGDECPMWQVVDVVRTDVPVQRVY